MPSFIPKGLGWRPDLPDSRDYRPNHGEVQRVFQHLIAPPYRRSQVFLDEFFPHFVADQNSDTNSMSLACVSLIEYFEYRSFGRVVEPSARFLTRFAPRLETAHCNACASLRSTIQSIAKFGIPPSNVMEQTAAQEDSNVADPVLFSFRDHYRSLIYIRLDSECGQADVTLQNIKAFLNAGLPLVFGFSVPSSLTTDENNEFRPTFDSIRGGQVATISGYDDNRLTATRGALRIRCSWSTKWGKQGFGWLPYTYVQAGLAKDFWSLIRPEWLMPREYHRPICIG